MIERLPTDQYALSRGATFAGASVGGHTRHTLDHFAAIARGAATGAMDYDRRHRGTPIETDSGAAAAEITRVIAALHALSAMPASTPVRVVLMLGPSAPSSVLESSLAREIAFGLSHAIHHQALIAAMLASTPQPLPPGFGVAPSTLAFRKDQACAR